MEFQFNIKVIIFFLQCENDEGEFGKKNLGCCYLGFEFLYCIKGEC